MTGSLLQEDKLPPKLPFVLSTEIREQISLIDSYNQDKPDEVLQWNNYINWVTGYISNRSIAFDYANRYIHYKNGAIRVSDMGINVTYMIKFSPQAGAYVYIFKMNLNTDEFGLKLPVYETGNGICPRNNQLRNNDKIMNDLLERIVKDELMRYNSNHILSEATDGKRVIRIDEDGIRKLLKSASLRMLSILESNNKTVTLDNGTRTKSLVTLSDGVGRCDIGEDDSCYAAQKLRSKEKGPLNEKYYNQFRMSLQEHYYDDEPLFGWHSVERAYRRADKKTMNAIRKSYNKYEKECIRKGDIPNYLGFSLWAMDKDVASCKQGKGDMFPNYYLGR